MKNEEAVVGVSNYLAIREVEGFAFSGSKDYSTLFFQPLKNK